MVVLADMVGKEGLMALEQDGSLGERCDSTMLPFHFWFSF